jgi:hypothetical protein
VFKKGRIDSLSFHPVYLEYFRPGFAEDTLCELIGKNITRFSAGLKTTFIKIDQQLFLTDSTCELSFHTPLKYRTFCNGTVAVKRNLLIHTSTANKLCNTLPLIQGKEIIDCCFLEDSLFHVIALTGSTGSTLGDHIVQYSIQDTGIIEVSQDYHAGYQPWKISTADLDGDSVPELCIALYKSGVHTADNTNRLFVYDWKGNKLSPKWFGSKWSVPFVDYAFLDLDHDGLDDLVTLENETSGTGTQRIAVYQWLGSGFWYYKTLQTGLTQNHLSGTNIKILTMSE